VRAPRRPLNPLLLRRAITSGINLTVLARGAGWVHYPDFYTDLHSEKIIASPLRVERLLRLAHYISFAPDEVFLDEPPKPRLVKRKSAPLDLHPETTAAEAEASR
jgi:hypothetical protein